MNKKEIAKRILTKAGYTTETEKTAVYLYVEELQQENEKLKTILSKVRKDEDLTIDEKITMEELER